MLYFQQSSSASHENYTKHKREQQLECTWDVREAMCNISSTPKWKKLWSYHQFQFLITNFIFNNECFTQEENYTVQQNVYITDESGVCLNHALLTAEALECNVTVSKEPHKCLNLKRMLKNNTEI
jgi:hypothetical protein